MKTDNYPLKKVFGDFGGNIHYILPSFQREYAWEESQWKTLLNDVLFLCDEQKIGKNKKLEHFFGALVVINDQSQKITVSTYRLVDGQQRLVSVSLLLQAIAQRLNNKIPDTANYIRKMLVNQDEQGDLWLKILPTMKYNDRKVYQQIINNQETVSHDSRIFEAFRFFKKEIDQVSEERCQKIFEIISECFQVVFITLGSHENPYRIFESLNAKGKPLTQADLVRNYIAMKLPSNRQEKLFSDCWESIEEVLQERRFVGKSRIGELTAFLRHYLAMHTGVLCNADHVYSRFRDRMESDEFTEDETFIEEIRKTGQFANYYDRLLRPEKEQVIAIRKALERLNELDISTAFPFLMEAYDKYNQATISQGEFCDGLKWLEIYLIRRYLVGKPTNYLNKMFPVLWKDVNPEKFSESIREALMQRDCPSDRNLLQIIPQRRLYENKIEVKNKIRFILDNINIHLDAKKDGYTVLLKEATIEHILPQSIQNSKAWKDSLGQEWEQDHQDYVHTLGNLTLVTQNWNSELSNASFITKKAKLAQHALRINADYFKQDIENWNSEAIRNRSGYLIQQILKIWPILGESSKLEYNPKPCQISIGGSNYQVKSSADMLFVAAEHLSTHGYDFKKLAEAYPTYLKKEPFKRRCKQLSNGWYILTNLSAPDCQRITNRVLEASGINKEDWNIEYQISFN